MKECPFCLAEAWHVEGNVWECTMCGREFKAAPPQKSKKDNLKKGGEEMGKPGRQWSEEQRKHFAETVARKKAAAGDPAASGGERKPKGNRDFAAEYSRRKEKEKNNGYAQPRVNRAYRRRSSVDPAAAANPAPAMGKLKIFCMKCGFRMELEDADLFHTPEAT